MEKMPVFIKIENYEDVLDVVNLIKEKVAGIKNVFSQVEQLKKEEDNKIVEWRKNIEQIDSKINNIDQILFEPEN